MRWRANGYKSIVVAREWLRPVYRVQYTWHAGETSAAEHHWRCLGESEFHIKFVESMPPVSARELAAMELDRLDAEQMIDFVVNRSFDRSMLVPFPDALAAAQ